MAVQFPYSSSPPPPPLPPTPLLHPPHLDVQLEGSDSLLQHSFPLLFLQLYAVHSTPVQLFEQVGAAHAREGKERQTLATLQPQRLLGNAAKDLSAR